MLKKFNFPLFSIALAMFICLFLSCTPQTDIASIYGTWKSAYGDGYTITEKTVTYDDGGYGFGYSGDIEEITVNYIYYSLKVDCKSQFYAVSYKNVTEISCEISGAYKAPEAGGKTYCSTLEEAKREFTIENGYYGYYGEYIRKE